MFVVNSINENKFDNIDINDILKESVSLRYNMHSHIDNELLYGIVDEGAIGNTIETIKKFILEKIKKILIWFENIRRQSKSKKKPTANTQSNDNKDSDDDSANMNRFSKAVDEFFDALDSTAHFVQISYKEEALEKFDEMMDDVNEKEKELLESLKYVKLGEYEMNYSRINRVGHRIEERIKSWSSSELAFNGQENHEYWKEKIPMQQKLADKFMKATHAIGSKIAISCNIEKTDPFKN